MDDGGIGIFSAHVTFKVIESVVTGVKNLLVILEMTIGALTDDVVAAGAVEAVERLLRLGTVTKLTEVLTGVTPVVIEVFLGLCVLIVTIAFACTVVVATGLVTLIDG